MNGGLIAPERLDMIKDLKPQMKQVNLLVIVLDVLQPYLTKDNHYLRPVKVADRTGSINVCIWDDPGPYIQPGDICRLIRCYTSLYKGQLTVYTGRGGKIIKTGEFCMTFVEVPNMSETPVEPPQANAPVGVISNHVSN